jgi:hypothetical protein
MKPFEPINKFISLKFARIIKDEKNISIYKRI